MVDTEQPTNQPRTDENIDPSNPLFIHSADSPSQSLVTTIFDGNGFNSWKRSMLIALSAKNKIGFINGEIVKPAEGLVKRRQWERCNDMVISWILNSVHHDIAESILSCETAKEMWIESRERFEQYNGAQLYQVQDQLNQISQGTDSISCYFTKLKKTWAELRSIWTMPSCTCPCSCGASQKIIKHDEDQKVIRFLMGLNETYNTVRGNILMMNLIPSINVAYSLIIQEEKQREITSQSPLNLDASAMVARNWGNQQGYNRTLRQQTGGGNYRDYPNNNNTNQANKSANYRNNPSYIKKKNNYFCTHCNMDGHSNERCYILHPELRNNNKKWTATTSTRYNQNGTGESLRNTANMAGCNPTEEYQQIMGSLSNFNVQNSSGDPNHAMMAGPFHEQIFGPW